MLSRVASVFAVLEAVVVLAACAIFALGVGGCDGPADGTPGDAASPNAGHYARDGRLAVQFVAGYQHGFEAAQSQGRPMLVFFTAEWCSYCHQMAREAFTDPGVIQLSEKFVCILVDADAEPEVCRYFGVRGYPTVQFISPGGVPLNRITGKKPAAQLAVAMQQALQAVARRNAMTEDDLLIQR